MVFKDFARIWVRMNSATRHHITGRGAPDRNEPGREPTLGLLNALLPRVKLKLIG